MRIIVSSATVGEWMPSFLNLDSLYTGDSQRLKVRFHQSGVGMLACAVSLTRLVSEEKPDLIIQAGIAGTFHSKWPLGKIVVVKDEILGDMGVTEDGKWKDIFDLKLEKSSYHPFVKRKLPNPWLPQYNLLKLPEVTAITVNEISTQQERIHQLRKKYLADIESMEGACLHYICREANIPFIQIRAISNLVGERDKTLWKMKDAIDALNMTIIKYIEKLYKIR